MTQTVDITPSPRVLRMLGQIDFKPWQCLAELIDNSIDSFITMRDEGIGVISPKVTIDLPSDQDLKNGTGVLTITDNGSGMTLEDLQKAVRAGYSGNDPVEKMGLFGMGFNISTARLGRRTEVWTTTAESGNWIGIVIDFDQLEKTKTFSTPILSRGKADFELENMIHGTSVRVMKLEEGRIRPLVHGAGKGQTRKKLGKIYGRVMASMGVSIIYAGDYLKPWKHCTWDPKRSVPTKNFGRVHARIDIEETLGSRFYCTTCWVWLEQGEAQCPSCGSSEYLLERQRRLKGWIGVQRFFDKDHFGFDLIRNGRVIEELDKSLFTFETIQGEKELEYPIDAIHWGGRIVGELEIDFVRVSHQKDSFDKLDPEWKQVVEIVRGNSPLRPQIAQRMGLPQNTSPLARLYAGYRSGHVGLDELVPGDANGNGLNGGIIREYVDRFYNDEEEYQSDEKWYALVLQADAARRGGSTGSDDAAGDLPTETETGTREGETNSFTEPVEPIIEDHEIDSTLSRTYELVFDQSTIPIKVTAKKAKKTAMHKAYSIDATGYNFAFTYNPLHNLFEESLITPVDYFLIDLSQHFHALSAKSTQDWPVSTIERMLREKYFPESLSSISKTAEIASALIMELREHLDEKIPQVSPIDLTIIDPDIIELIRLKAWEIDLGDTQFVDKTVREGSFIKYIDNKFLIKIISIWPQLLMDGEFFSNPYQDLDDSLKQKAIQMILDGITDVLWLAGEGRDALSKDFAWRLRYGRALASLRLVTSWRS